MSAYTVKSRQHRDIILLLILIHHGITRKAFAKLKGAAGMRLYGVAYSARSTQGRGSMKPGRESRIKVQLLIVAFIVAANLQSDKPIKSLRYCKIQKFFLLDFLTRLLHF